MENHISTKSTKNTIEFSFKEVKNNRKQILFQLLVDLFILGLLYVAIVFGIQSMFEIYTVSLFAIVPGLLLILLMSYFKNNKKVLSRISMIVLVIVVGCLFLFNDTIMNGLFLVLNQMGIIMGSHTEIVIQYYYVELAEDLHAQAISVFLSFFSFILSYLCCYVLKRASYLLIWLFIGPLFLVQLLTGISPAIYYNFALFLAGVLIANYSFMTGSNQNKWVGTHKNSIMIFSTSLVLMLFILTFLLLNAIEPLSGYTKNSTVLSLKQSILHKVEDFRYEKEQTNTFTQGNFSELGELELSDTPALKVVMSQPVSLYLRGYVGSKYTSSAWRSLDYKIYNDSYSLFYWLRESQFHALNQLSDVNDLTANGEEKEEKVSITINNVNANSKYMYTPYELTTNPNSMGDVNTFDDSMVVSNDIFGNRLYEYKAAGNIVKDYPSVANDLYQLKENEQSKNYLKNESFYNEYVYNHYVDIPKDTILVLESHFKELKNLNGNRMSYEDIIKNVKSNVADTLKYNTDVKSMPQSKDFIQYLLEESREGYATHYATLATLLFRSYGIPARYVEGYLITPQDVKDVEEFEEITIEGKNAHAWTEIYLDKMGWIPIEVTPPYYDVMEKTNLLNYPEATLDSSENMETTGNSLSENTVGNGSTNPSVESQQVKDDEPAPTNTMNMKPKEELSLLIKLFIGLLIVLFCLLVAYIIVAITKQRNVKKRNESFQDKNYHASIPRMFAYSVFLLHYGGISERGGSMYSYLDEIGQMYGEEYVEMFKKVIIINQECLYSDNQIQIEKYEQMKRFMDYTLSKVFHSKNMLQRLKMKLWDFIY